MHRRSAWLVVVAIAVAALVVFAALRGCSDASAPEQRRPEQLADGDGPRRARSRLPEQRARTAPPDAPAGAPTAPAAHAELADAAAPPAKDVALPTVRIHGRVIDDLRRGVAYAAIEIRAWSGAEPNVQWFTTRFSADESGVFERAIEEARATIGFCVETSADGFVEGWKSVDRAEYDPSRGVEIAMEKGRAILGRVVDGDRRPIAGTTVQLWYGSETTWPTGVDAEGRFRTPRRGPRREFELIVEAPGFTRRALAIPAADEDERDLGDVVFRRGGRVAGVVVGTDGRPIEDVRLEWAVAPTRDRAAPACRTDGAGRFTFEGVGEDPVTIHVDGAERGGPAGARRFFRGGAADVAPGRTDVRIVARAEATLRLRFVDAETGAAVDVKRAEYGLRGEGTPVPERLGQGASSSPLDGTILSAECGRRYDLTVRAAGFADGHVRGIEVGDVAELSIDVPMRRAK